MARVGRVATDHRERFFGAAIRRHGGGTVGLLAAVAGVDDSAVGLLAAVAGVDDSAVGEPPACQIS
jgi:hypothetical protein